jgi:hypothetical protein
VSAKTTRWRAAVSHLRLSASIELEAVGLEQSTSRWKIIEAMEDQRIAVWTVDGGHIVNRSCALFMVVLRIKLNVFIQDF